MDRGDLILYQAQDGRTAVEVRLKDETVWLNQAQMQVLFGRERSVITKHINNVFKEGELDKNQVCVKFAQTAADGKTYQVAHYNLDVIISVGYRVKSPHGAKFRIWATSVLREYLVKGYSFNQKRLAEKGLGETRQVIALLADTLESRGPVMDEGRAILHIVQQYARTWRLLWQFDEGALTRPQEWKKPGPELELKAVRRAVATLRGNLMDKGEATDLFGNERNEGLAGILGAVQQTFGGQDLYPGVVEKAAHLLYFVIKDHPFTDGNKRIGSFLMLYFLQTHGLLDSLNLDNKALVALTLLTAASDPKQKDLLIGLIMNLLTEAG